MITTSTRILIVEDMPTMRKLMKLIFAKLGYKDLIEAGDGAEGFLALSRSEIPVGMIVSDYNMPNSSGLDLLKRVRADSRFKDLPFVMVTAEGEAPQIQEAMKYHVDEYIIKPFNAEKLQERLAKVAEKRNSATTAA